MSTFKLHSDNFVSEKSVDGRNGRETPVYYIVYLLFIQ